jgi:hypothetical protein
MLRANLLLSLLASVASSQLYDSATSSNCTLMPIIAPVPKVPVDSLLPSFGLVTSSATITPPTSSTPIIPPTSTSLGDDSPASSSLYRVPASESFNPSNAPAFTSGIPTFPGMYSSTQCAHQVTSTLIRGYPVGALSSAVPLETPPKSLTPPVDPIPTPSGSITAPFRTPVPEHGAPKPPVTPLDASVPLPFSTGLPAKPPYPTGGLPAIPPFSVGAGRPNRGHRGGRPGFEWGRPRPSGWGVKPDHGAARPTGGPQPSAGFDIENDRPGMGLGAAQPTGGPRSSVGFDVGKNKPSMGPDAAATLLNTLETRVRPTPTEVPTDCHV